MCGLEVFEDNPYYACPRCGCVVEDGPCPNCDDDDSPEPPTPPDLGVDPSRWRIIRTGGSPAAALYYNGRGDSLPQEMMEEMEQAIREIASRWEPQG